MKKKSLFLIGLLVVLAGIYVVYFTDWWKPKHIHIASTVRANLLARQQPRNDAEPPYTISFSLGQEYGVTAIEVVPAADYAQDPKTHRLWHLTAEAAPAPVKGFIYGANLPGLNPYVAGTTPYPLAPNVEYKIIVHAGRLQGEHNFTIAPQTPVNAE